MVKAAAPLELMPIVARPSGSFASFAPEFFSTSGSTSFSIHSA